MVLEEVPIELVNNLSSVVFWLQAVGGILLFYILFNIISAILNYKKRKELKKINSNLEEIKKILKTKK